MSPQLPPEGISQSAWETVRAILALHSYAEQPAALARAIDAATERAALIADEHRKSPRYTDWPYATACADIAAAIRQGSQPSNAIPVRGTVR